ncbi:hypothetical protein AK812_SmicGene19292 [Symbiodinium microadriaticum]|uniref:Uncharacterized protein n=1 Tax=Symbiodinium microadriaticum TaxID=2951 RepID=A0A1Q9DT13_SYMMI|nr:hypothetical protein AK812_SmicGene19292 [Symbiodinium microadriaticum]CAE7903386.1 unnamed protein product [Symbiodinium microadriaticum]
MKSIYDQSRRSCGLINRISIFQPDKNGNVVRKLSIDHKLGDTKAKMRYLRRDKSEATEPVSDKRQKDDSSWSRRQWSSQNWWDQDESWGTASSSSWNWSWSLPPGTESGGNDPLRAQTVALLCGGGEKASCARRLKQYGAAQRGSEAKRLSQLPNIATVNFIPMVKGARALMERLLPLEIEYLKAPHMERLRSDIVSALQTLHGCGIVHADIHRQNVMVRRDPPSFVLIDLGGTAGESIYPLSLGYGAIGEGGTRHRSWIDSAVDPQTIVQAGLWNREGAVCRSETTFLNPTDQRGNNDGAFVVEQAAGSSSQAASRPANSGRWEQSAVYAKFYLSCGLRTRGTRGRPVFFVPPPPTPVENQVETTPSAETEPRLPSQITVFPLTGVWAEPGDVNMESMD